MRVDAHQHFWSVARSDYGWLTPDVGSIYRNFLPADLAPLIARHGITRTVLVQAAPTVGETDYLLALADATPFVGAVVGWIDFAEPRHRRHLERFSRHPKFRAVRPMIQDLSDDGWALRSELAWAFDAVTELGLHFEFLGKPKHLDVAAELLRRRPGVPVVLDHCLKPAIRNRAFEPWASKIAAIARDSTAVCKLSGLATEAAPGWTTDDLKPYVEHVVAAFGPDRVMWGSDWPVLELNGSYDSWMVATLALIGAHPGVDAMLGGTAARVYRLT
jgi:L-fuconolactonase